MSRVSRAEADRNRTAIEEVTARLIRERGLAVSVADLMSAVGLTHGGFYGHFESKDELAAIAMARAFEDSAVRWRKRVATAQQARPDDERAALTALFQHYLNPQNRSTPATGCPLAALATDVAREPVEKPVYSAYLAGLTELLDILQAAQPVDPQQPGLARHSALNQMATLVGVMVLARATRGAPLSDELLSAVRDELVGDPPASS